jgi:hypothetical protein
MANRIKNVFDLSIAQPFRKIKTAESNVRDQLSNIGSNIKDQLTGGAGIPGYQKQDVNFGQAITRGLQEDAYDYQAPVEESSTSDPAGDGKYLDESLTNITQVSGRRNSYIAQKSSKMFGPNKYRNQ